MVRIERDQNQVFGTEYLANATVNGEGMELTNRRDISNPTMAQDWQFRWDKK
jgi:hypothetical protein